MALTSMSDMRPALSRRTAPIVVGCVLCHEYSDFVTTGIASLMCFSFFAAGNIQDGWLSNEDAWRRINTREEGW